MTRLLHTPTAVLLAVVALSAGSVSAQTRTTQTTPSSGDIRSEAAQGADATAVPGATIFVIDSSRHLAMINVGTKIVRPLAKLSIQLSDIAFNPLNHLLYGISYNAVYVFDPRTYALSQIARLGVDDANALVFNSAGTAYFSGYNTGRLYSFDVTTGKAKIVGSTLPFRSAGDLTFYNDQLVMSATYATTNPDGGSGNYLITLNPATAERIGKPVFLDIHQVYGLASTGKNELYGLASIGTGNTPGLYQLFPAAANVSNRDTLLKNLSASGLSLVVGTAYNGNYQP